MSKADGKGLCYANRTHRRRETSPSWRSRQHGLHHGMDRGSMLSLHSIIEQNAAVFIKILGENNVLEHHSGIHYDENDESVLGKRLATENWDMPVVVTTTVQFFESLFANRTSKCRKLHHLANSVIIFDEAQLLPLKYLLPCVRAISELVYNYKSTCVLCSATSPSGKTVSSRNQKPGAL